MRRVTNNEKNKSSKKFSTNLKRAWRKLKYLDKTQLNYFIVTSFIGLFCVFTGTTYSLFTVSKYLNAATITIAKLNYTLSSTAQGYSNGSISVPAGETAYVDLTLSSANSISTKYALNYTVSEGSANVYYSQNLAYNFTGTIGSNGSSINLRAVVVNDSNDSATVDFNVSSGYVQNADLSSNINLGYYEQDITIRTLLLDENFSNLTQSPTGTFPAKTSDYAYLKTVCSDDSANPVWDFDSWTLSINQLTKQVSCDVYFKKFSTNNQGQSSDIEVYYILVKKDGSELFAFSAPTSGYTYSTSYCSSNATSTWNSSTGKLEISGIDGRTMCVARFTED